MKYTSTSLLIILIFVPFILSNNLLFKFDLHESCSSIRNITLSEACYNKTIGDIRVCQNISLDVDDQSPNEIIEDKSFDCFVQELHNISECADESQKLEELKRCIKAENGPCIDHINNSTDCESNSTSTITASSSVSSLPTTSPTNSIQPSTSSISTQPSSSPASTQPPSNPASTQPPSNPTSTQPTAYSTSTQPTDDFNSTQPEIDFTTIQTKTDSTSVAQHHLQQVFVLIPVLLMSFVLT